MLYLPVPHFKDFGIAKWDIQVLDASVMQIYETAVKFKNEHKTMGKAT